MNLKLERIFKGEEYTIGKLYADNKYVCDTLEDKDRGLTDSMSLIDILAIKIYGKTAIPIGTYRINMNTVSPKFKDRAWAKSYNGILPRLLNVKGFEGVLIHVGNKKEDTLGCILVGLNKAKGMVVNSIACFNLLMSLLVDANKRSESIEITIE